MRLNIKTESISNTIFLLYVISIPLFAYSTSLHWINWLLAILLIVVWILFSNGIIVFDYKFCLLIFWYIWTGIGLLIYGVNPESGLHKMITTGVTWTIVFVIISYISYQTPDFIKKIFIMLFTSIVAIALPILFNLSSLYEPIRNSLGLYNPNHSSILFGLAISMGIYLITITKRRVLIFAEIIGIFLLFLGIISTGSRQGLLIAFFGILLSIILFFDLRKFFVIVIIIAISLFAFEHYQDNINQLYIVKRINRTSISAGDETRVKLIEAGLEMFKDKPIIGVGFNQFSEYSEKYGARKGSYAHNNYIEILVNGGALGFIAYYCFLLMLLLSSIKNYKVSSLHKLMLVIICSILMGDMVRITYYQNIEPFLIGVVYTVESSFYINKYFIN